MKRLKVSLEEKVRILNHMKTEYFQLYSFSVFGVVSFCPRSGEKLTSRSILGKI